jgi:hypothetical protein
MSMKEQDKDLEEKKDTKVEQSKKPEEKMDEKKEDKKKDEGSCCGG